MVVALLVEHRFRQQRSEVQTQSLANFHIEHMFTVDCIEKTKKEKEAGNGSFLKP